MLELEETGFYNLRSSRSLFYHLAKCGVDYFCASPGSSSSPLALGLNFLENPKTLVHFDERGMAFHALGYAKASQKPAALFCASGTAVANLFPAIMEGALSRISLIVITADRSQDKYFSGENQTVVQQKMFEDYVKFQCDISMSDPFITEEFIAKMVSHAVFMSKGGPVHINCQMRWPLFSSKEMPEHLAMPTHYEKSISIPTESTLDRLSKMMPEKGVIVIGANPFKQEISSLFALSEKLNWPIFADILSNCRQNHPNLIPYYNFMLKGEKPECVLHFGDRLTSKNLQEWLTAPYYFHVADHSDRHDPKHKVTHRVECDPFVFCEKILPYIETKGNSWLKSWQEKKKAITEKLEEYFTENTTLTEPKIFWDLAKTLQTPLFLSNSMPVRDADTFLFPTSERHPILSNRGVSGSDGVIATATGAAQGLKTATLLILGDIAALHDLNSLALVKKAKHPITCMIINNGGGGIFSFLPIAKKKEVFEEFIATTHDFKFEHAAKMFDIPIIELETNREDNVRHHEEITELCASCFCTDS